MAADRVRPNRFGQTFKLGHVLKTDPRKPHARARTPKEDSSIRTRDKLEALWPKNQLRTPQVDTRARKH